MRRLISTLSLLVLASLLLWPQQVIIVKKKAAAGCTTAKDSAFFDYTEQTWADLATITGTDHHNSPVALQFTTSGTIVVTEYTISIETVTVGGNVTASIYTDSSNSLGSLVSGTDVSLNITSIGKKTFTLPTPKTDLNGTYWLRFYSADTVTNMSSRYIDWGQSHRIHIVLEYMDTSAVEVALFGCAQ